MSDLTDAHKKSFIDKIIATLTTSAADLTAKGWDPAQRVTNLQNGVTSVTNDEGLVAQLDAALASAVTTRRTDLDNNYALASQTVKLVEGVLGKDAPLVRDLRPDPRQLQQRLPARHSRQLTLIRAAGRPTSPPRRPKSSVRCRSSFRKRPGSFGKSARTSETYETPQNPENKRAEP